MSDSEDEVYSREASPEPEEPEPEEEEEVVEEKKSTAEMDALMAKKLAEIEKIDVTTVRVDGSHLDEGDQEMLQKNFEYRQSLASEIKEMKIRSERRKIERAEEEKAANVARSEEQARRKAEEEERKRQKEEEARARKARREAQNVDKNVNTGNAPNFVISKKSGAQNESQLSKEEEDAKNDKMSKEQEEQEKAAILAQRIFVLDIEGFNADKLRAKAESLFQHVMNLVGQNYDMEKRFREQAFDMQELAQRARQQNQVGTRGGGGIKRSKPAEGEIDKIQEKYSGAPNKVVMYSIFERSQDKRTYEERHNIFHGPVWAPYTARIYPTRKVQFDGDSGLPTYVPLSEAEIARYMSECENYGLELSDLQSADPDEFVYTGGDEDDEEEDEEEE